MPEQIRIPVKDIAPNPYQTRFEENAERIANIALSIAQDGLLQPPTVRKAEAHPARPSIPDDAMWYELAFGHTRTAAWKLCNDVRLGKAISPAPELYKAVRDSQEDFSTMPVFIADIDDEKMFRYAVTENSQRADLSPVEEAAAMKKAMDEFKYTSEQAGALFGKSGATVRGKVRLLDLPEEARTKLHEGEISESAARGLVTLQRIAPKSVKEALKDILDGDDPEDAIDNALRGTEGVTRIYSSDVDVSAKQFNHLPELTVDDIPAALGLQKDKAFMTNFRSFKKNVSSDLGNLLKVWKESSIKDLPALAEKVEHLINPPACTACPFYARADGSDYCAWKACFERKQASNRIDSLERASKGLGIAIYQESDGEKVLLDRWNDMHKRHVDKKDADLRLMIVSGHSNGYWGHVLSIPSHVGVFAVGKLCKKCKEAKANSAADRGQVTKESTPAQIKKAIESQLNSEVVNGMMDAVFFDIFAAQMDDVLSGIKSVDFLGVLIESIDAYDNDRAEELQGEKRNAAAELKYRRQCVMCTLIYREVSWNTKHEALSAKQPVARLAKDVRKLAERWGVKLGKGFDQAVADADIRINQARKDSIAAALAERGIVSTATGKGKSQ
jgi:ParB family chromosome partitioning protein